MRLLIGFGLGRQTLFLLQELSDGFRHLTCGLLQNSMLTQTRNHDQERNWKNNKDSLIKHDSLHKVLVNYGDNKSLF
jgi:hypothetical protein